MAIVEYVSEEERREITEKMTDALYRGAEPIPAITRNFENRMSCIL